MSFTFLTRKQAEKMKRAKERAGAFNARPPVWAYWVFGLIVIVAIQAVKFL